MIIRPMIQSDVPALLTLWKESNLHFANKKREMYECNMMIEMNPTSCFVAAEDEQIVGSVFGIFNGRRGWINHLAIHPNHQKKGLGSKLLNAAVQDLQKRGATRIVLGVSTSNLKTMEFYYKNGFQIMDDAVYLTKDLDWKVKV